MQAFQSAQYHVGPVAEVIPVRRQLDPRQALQQLGKRHLHFLACQHSPGTEMRTLAKGDMVAGVTATDIEGLRGIPNTQSIDLRKELPRRCEDNHPFSKCDVY